MPESPASNTLCTPCLQINIRSPIQEIDTQERAPFALDIVRCTNPTARHSRAALDIPFHLSLGIDTTPDGTHGPKYTLPPEMFSVKYEQDPVVGIGTHCGFFFCTAPQCVQEYMLSQSDAWGLITVNADKTDVSYKVRIVNIDMDDYVGKSKTTSTSQWFQIHLNAPSLLFSDDAFQRIVKDHLAKADLTLANGKFLIDKETQVRRNIFRGEFTANPGFQVLGLKCLPVMPINNNPDHNLRLDISREFCATHKIHNKCLKLLDTGTTGVQPYMNFSDFCSCAQPRRPNGMAGTSGA